MTEWNGCYCGEFAQPTIAPDEFGETCFHEHDKCEVPTTKVPDQTVIRLLRQKVDRMTERARKVEAANGQGLDVEALISARVEQVARAENAEAAIERVRELCDRIWDDARYAHKYGFLEVVREVRYALEGDSNE